MQRVMVNDISWPWVKLESWVGELSINILPWSLLVEQCLWDLPFACFIEKPYFGCIACGILSLGHSLCTLHWGAPLWGQCLRNIVFGSLPFAYILEEPYFGALLCGILSLGPYLCLHHWGALLGEHCLWNIVFGTIPLPTSLRSPIWWALLVDNCLWNHSFAFIIEEPFEDHYLIIGWGLALWVLFTFEQSCGAFPDGVVAIGLCKEAYFIKGPCLGRVEPYNLKETSPTLLYGPIATLTLGGGGLRGWVLSLL